MDFFSSRRASLLGKAKADGVDGYLVTNPVNVLYLSGRDGPDSCLIDTRSRLALFEPTGAIGGGNLRLPNLRGVPCRRNIAAISEEAARMGIKSLGVESESITVAELDQLTVLLPSLKIRPVSNRVEGLRALKDQSEIESIRSAARASERALAMFLPMIREQDNEKGLSDAMDMYIRRTGARRSSFETVVAFGEREAVHSRPAAETKLNECSKLTIGWGADNGYKCEFWRTVPSPFPVLPTRRSRQERTAHRLDKVAAAVRNAFQAAVVQIKPGVQAADVAAASRAVLEAEGLDQYADVLVGNGIGLEVRESPWLHADSSDILHGGMVLTVAPGVHIPEWGSVRFGGPVLVASEKTSPLFDPRHVVA